jgi:multiple sugar transport system permease protein
MRIRKSKSSREWTYLRFAVPALAVLVLLTMFPFLYSIWISLNNWDLTSMRTPRFAGLNNYTIMVGDSLFHKSMLNTLLFLLITLPVEIMLGFTIAMLLNRDGEFFKALRVPFLLPMTITPIVAALVWRMLYHNEYGALTYFLGLLGCTQVPVWLGDTKTALACVAAVDIWQWTPFVMLLFLSGLQSIPEDYYEVAEIEGASSWQVITKVTIPCLRPVFLVAVLFRTIDIMKLFDVLYILTKGGPSNTTETMSYYTYRQGFGFFRMGYASALSLVVLLIVTISSQWLLKLLRRVDYMDTVS